MLLSRVICSTVDVAAGAPLPTEFRMFSAGLNATSKGEFLFDAKAAASVMANYRREGVDLIVDVEHDSLNNQARAMRSDAGNAVAHFQLELRADGSLWAVNVTWNQDGETRLRNRTQRYISPAFNVNEDNEITSVMNAALVSMPATYNAPALVAARKTPHDALTCAAVELCKIIITRQAQRKLKR